MPNHVHGNLFLTDVVTQSKRHALPEIIRAFKTFSARKINILLQQSGTSVWQRGFYDHIIRGERDLDRVREYIHNNPLRWQAHREDHDSR